MPSSERAAFHQSNGTWCSRCFATGPRPLPPCWSACKKPPAERRPMGSRLTWSTSSSRWKRWTGRFLTNRLRIRKSSSRVCRRACCNLMPASASRWRQNCSHRRQNDEAALGVLRGEASERAVTLDAIKGQINLLGLQERPEEIMETAKALAGHLTFLADNQQMDMLTITLPMLQEARGRADVHRGAIDAELARVLNAGLLDRLVRDALQTHADASDDLLQALVAVRDHTVPHLIRMLERRPADAQRVELCNLMTKICAGQAGLIGSRLPGASPHLARDLVFVLGELRDPAAAGYLARLAAHPEYLVRREAIDALRKMPSDQSRGALVEFFRDPDPRIQYSLIEGAEVAHDERIMTWMQDAIRSPDWTPGAIAVKVAAMKALARMRADEALPLLRRIARARWVFGQGRRTVRQAARQIVDDWERSRQRPA